MRKALVLVVTLMLAGCHLVDTADRSGPGPQTPDGGTVIPPVISDPPPLPPTPQPPTIDWPVSMETVTEKIVQSAVIEQSDVLLIDNVVNRSNIDVNATALTSQLKQNVSLTNRFSLIAEEQLQSARQALGLQNEDSLNSRSKTIGLARYLAVPYILYTTIEGQNPDLNLSSQIMQVQTGELIWSETTPVRLN